MRSITVAYGPYEDSGGFLSYTNGLYKIMVEHKLKGDDVVVALMNPVTLAKLSKDLFCRWHIRGKTAKEMHDRIQEQLDREKYIGELAVVSSVMVDRNYIVFVVKE